MAKKCDITGKTSIVGGGYSNRTRATQFNPTGKRRRHVNLQKKTVFVPEIGKKVTFTASAKGLKTLRKNGAYATLKKAGIIKRNTPVTKQGESIRFKKDNPDY